MDFGYWPCGLLGGLPGGLLGGLPDVLSGARPIAKRLLFVSWLLLLFASGQGQNFNANTYYQQGLRFESGGDFITARESYNNALRIQPNFFDAAFGKARVAAALGETEQAKAELNMLIRDYTIQTAAPYILLAQLHLADAEYSAAQFNLVRARGVPQNNTQLEAERNYLEGELARFEGQYNRALELYAAAMRLNPSDANFYLADAQVRFALGFPREARATLENYITVSGNRSNADVFSLLGQASWAMSDLASAQSYFEAAVNARSRALRDQDGLSRDYRHLALVYFAQGDFQDGQSALRSTGDLLSYLLGQLLPWVLMALVLLALHLVGESLVDNEGSLEIVEGPQPWTVEQVYGTLFTALPLAFIAMLAYSYFAYSNWLALLTPLQSANTRAVFFIVLLLLLIVLSVRKVRALGWKQPLQELLGDHPKTPVGIGVGIALLAAVLAYRFWVSRNYADVLWLQGYYLDMSRLTPFVVIATLLIPVAEVYFRAFVTAPMNQRYSRMVGLLIATALFSLVLASPIPLVVAIGASLGGLFYRDRDGLTPMIAQLVLHLGLILAVGFSSFARSLMMSMPF
jgi:tetratricopeptide (TPR) repeat protein